MSLSSRIEESLGPFVLFGGLLNAELRKAISHALAYHLFEPEYEAEPVLDSLDLARRFPNWEPIIRELFQSEGLRSLTVHNEDLALSVAQNALEWCKKTYDRMGVSNDHAGEASEFEKWQKNAASAPLPRWEGLLEELKKLYPDLRQNWNFYKKELSKELRDEAGRDLGAKHHIQRIGIIRTKVLEEWKGILFEKINQFEADYLTQEFDLYYQDLKQKYTQLNHLGEMMAPYYNYLGRLLNGPIGEWNEIPWGQIEKYVEMLRDDPKLKELIELLGKWQMAQLEEEEHRIETLQPLEKWKPNPYGKSEVIGIHHSDQIASMLPSEIALLSHPETSIILSKKYVEKKLLTFQYRSFNFDSKPEVQEETIRQPKIEEKGPIILCIDTSGSMFGRPEQVAKAMAFVLVSIAYRQKRKCFLVSFSTELKTMELTGMERNLDGIISFLTMSFHGGTDIQPALREALKMLKTENYKKADVLVISDFILPRVEDKIIAELQRQRKEDNTHFHSLYITRRVDPQAVPITIFDNHWIYDLDNPRVIRQTLEEFNRI